MKNKTQTLSDLLTFKIQALYDIEQEIMKAIPSMVKKSTDTELKVAFEDHLKETEEHVMRLEKIFALLGEKPKKLKADAIRGLIKDAKWVMKNVKTEETRDANLIAAAQYVEHYEMAGYGSAVAWAEITGHEEIADILKETLEEEKAADQKLNSLAMSKINREAMLETI